MSDSLRGRVAFNNSWARNKGLLPSLDGTDPIDSDYGKTSTFPNYAISGNIDWVASPNLFFGVRGGYYMSDQNDTNVTEVPRYNWPATNNVTMPNLPPGFAAVPASFQRSTGFSSVLSNTKVVKDEQTRANFQADGTVYGNLGGSHQLKFGLQFDRVGNDVDSGEAAGRVTIRWDSRWPPARPIATGTSQTIRFAAGPSGIYSVRSNGVDPRRGFITQGKIHTTTSACSSRTRGRSTTG